MYLLVLPVTRLGTVAQQHGTCSLPWMAAPGTSSAHICHMPIVTTLYGEQSKQNWIAFEQLLTTA